MRRLRTAAAQAPAQPPPGYEAPVLQNSVTLDYPAELRELPDPPAGRVEQLKLSDGCRKPDGSLDCEAYRFLKSGAPVDLARRSLDGRRSAGVLACMKLGNQLVHGRNAMGSEDGFCRFRDGSLTTTGALETYSVRVIE